MASLDGFDAAQHESTGFDPLPPGLYTAIVESSEEKATKANNGKYLKLTLQVVDGEYKGRKIFSNINIENQNPTATAIGLAELADLCRATGVLRPKDSCELHNIPVTIKVAIEKRKDTGEEQNRIKKYAPRQKAATTTQPTAASSKTPPWKR
jgi:hypothetical protein